jgi:hypothetical protein
MRDRSAIPRGLEPHPMQRRRGGQPGHWRRSCQGRQPGRRRSYCARHPQQDAMQAGRWRRPQRRRSCLAGSNERRINVRYGDGKRRRSQCVRSPTAAPAPGDDPRLMYLSVSSLALFWRCPERWRRRYREPQRELQNGPMLVARAVAALSFLRAEALPSPCDPELPKPNNSGVVRSGLLPARGPVGGQGRCACGGTVARQSAGLEHQPGGCLGPGC